MEQSTYQYLYNDVINALHNKRLLSALQSLQGLATTLKSWNVKEETDTLLDSYHILLTYMAKGAHDPERNKMYKGFVKRAYELAEVLKRVGLLTNKTSFYTTSLLTLQKIYGDSLSLNNLLNSKISSRDKFDAIWLSGAWSADDEIAVTNYVNNNAVLDTDKCLLLSATTLSAIQFFDIAKYRVLLDNAMSTNIKIRVRALTGLIFLHIIHTERIQLYSETTARLSLMAEIPQFTKEIERLQMQLFLSLETKRIERNLQNEIIPQVMKRIDDLRLDRSLGLDDIKDKLSEININPEWEEDGKPSKLSAYMHEFVELQERGADMYMGSFKVMKQRFPFFNIVSNWFWPFTMDHPDIPQSSRKSTMVKMMISNVGLCDSDKYSFCLMAEHMPSANRTDHLQEEFLNQMQEMQQERATDIEQTFKDELRSYVQDFYRFSNLYLHHEQFVNPFQRNLFIVDYYPFSTLLNKSDFLLRIANFVFKDKSYNLAIEIFSRLPQDALNAEILQKWGYCYEKNHNIVAAIDCYEKANLLKSHSTWTMYRLATCYRLQKKYQKAFKCYDEIATLQPESVQTALHQAECLIHLKQYDEAFKFLFKANYLDPDSHATERALAWCSLLTKKYDQAEKYYLKVLSDTPTPTDYLNAGHSAWLSGNIVNAIERYRKALPKENAENFLSDDRAFLINAGITTTDMAMMIDAVLSNL